MQDKIILENLEVECIIGIFDWERKVKQKLEISLELDCDLSKASKSDSIVDTVDYKTISKSIVDLVKSSKYFLIETIAEKVSELCIANDGVFNAKVTVSKPGAIRGSKNISVQISRPNDLHTVFLGVGSNIEPEKNIQHCLNLLRSRFLVKQVSPVYKSEAWGVGEKQEDYLNLAVMVKTEKDIFAVRGETNWIEKIVGRKRSENKFASRPIDIDLLLFDSIVDEKDGGTLPQFQLLTQQFVYLPMLDIAPDLIVPGFEKALNKITPNFDNPELVVNKLRLILE